MMYVFPQSDMEVPNQKDFDSLCLEMHCYETSAVWSSGCKNKARHDSSYFTWWALLQST